MLVALSVALTSALAQEAVRSIRYFEMEPTPYGEILVSKPVLEWKIWGEGVGIKTVEALVDEKSVDSNYSVKSNSVVASINRPLAAGEHTVRFSVSFASGHKVEKSWEFKVARGAIAQFPKLQENQEALLNQVNTIRKQHSLPPVMQNNSLTAAAQAHVEYMVANGTSGHREESRNSGYTGKTPGDRAKAFGYYERSGEAVAVSSRSLEESVENLFDAPYHRLMFLQPGTPDFGAGNLEEATCVKFGGKHENAFVLSPANGAQQVRREWDGIETPDPMASSSLEGPFGYPIILAAFGNMGEGLKFISGSLKDGNGKDIATKILHPNNDEHAKSCFILIPVKPLKAHTKYVVNIKFTKSRQATRQSWSFTTGQ